MSAIEIFIGGLCYLCIAFIILALIRCELVFWHRRRAIQICYRLRDWADYLEKPEYQEMMWDWRKWTFADFYPELTKAKP